MRNVDALSVQFVGCSAAWTSSQRSACSVFVADYFAEFGECRLWAVMQNLIMM